MGRTDTIAAFPLKAGAHALAQVGAGFSPGSHALEVSCVAAAGI